VQCPLYGAWSKNLEREIAGTHLDKKVERKNEYRGGTEEKGGGGGGGGGGFCLGVVLCGGRGGVVAGGRQGFPSGSRWGGSSKRCRDTGMGG